MAAHPHNILITGASGYLGGTFLTRRSETSLPPHGKIYALVRNEIQADAVQKYGAEPIEFDPHDEGAVRSQLVKHEISVVFYLIDAMSAKGQVNCIKALAEVKRRTGIDVHLIHTSGAKMFSSHSGAPTDRPLFDNDPELYNIQQTQKSPHARMQAAVDANNTVIKEAESHGVHCYIFAPCIVYGQGEGFGKKISIQTVAIVKAAKALRRVYKVDQGRPIWPVCHVRDNAALYLLMLHKILAGESIPSGKNGYYLASPGSVAWDDLYSAMATALKENGAVDVASVAVADDLAMEKIGQVLGCAKDMVPVQIGGLCTFTARNAKAIGWAPEFAPEHIIENAGDEVQLILRAI